MSSHVIVGELLRQGLDVLMLSNLPRIENVFFNNRHTTIVWADGKKTTVGCMEGEHFDEYAGFTAAIAKRIYGSSTTVKRILEEHKVVQTNKKEAGGNA